MLFYFIVFLIITVDQLLKYLVHYYIHLGQSIQIINNILKLTYVRNTGAAFSLFVGYSSGLAAISLMVVIAIIYFHYKKPNDRLLQLGLASLLGGSLGNLVDRLTRGFVVDYIDFGFWPVFNFADIMINVGVAILAYSILIGGRNHASDNC
ncbi:MAG: signal peptidase II [bacterium]